MRGCPCPCELCSVSTQNGVTMRFRPADEVIRELRTLGKLLLFADDNVMIHRAYSKELFTDDTTPPDAPLPIEVIDPRLDALRAPRRPDAKEQRKVLPVVG